MIQRFLRLAVVVSAALGATPLTVYAQKDQFFDALLPLYHASAGTYGDEGPQLNAAVDALASALARWDAQTREAEAGLRAQLRGATPPTALQAHTLLASMYIERSRFADALREFDQDLLIDPKRAAFHRFKGSIYTALGRAPDAAAAFHSAWAADPSDPQNAYHLVVNQSSRTTATERTQARTTLASLEGALLQRQQPKADMPFLGIRPIDDDAGGAMAFAPAAYADAIAKLLTGQFDMGMSSLRTAVAQDPLVADQALRSEPMVRGMAALKAGQVRDALDAMRAALTLFPGSSEVNRLLATTEIVNGDVTAGIGHLREAVRLNPKNERAWVTLTSTLDDLGEWVDAASALRTAVQELPGSGELRWQLVVVAGKRQRTDAADLELIGVADRLTLLAGNAELYGRVARLAQGHLEYDRALALLQRAVVLTPNNAGAHRALGRAYVDHGQEDEGYAELVVALWLDPADAETLTAIGRLHLAAGRYTDAVAALTRAVTLAPTDVQILQALGEALVRSGDADAGQLRLEAAASLEERAVEAQRRARQAGMLTLQAELEISQGNPAGAIDLWRQAAAAEGRDVAIRLRLADALVAANRTAEAVPELQQAIALNAGPDAHRRLANAYAALGRTDDSAREMNVYTEERLRQLRERSGVSVSR